MKLLVNMSINPCDDYLISGTEDISNTVHISIGAKKGIHSLFN